MNRTINIYIGALVITIFGSFATLAIVKTAFNAEAYTNAAFVSDTQP